MNFELECGNIL